MHVFSEANAIINNVGVLLYQTFCVFFFEMKF